MPWKRVTGIPRAPGTEVQLYHQDMSYIHVLILAVIEGLTEFLPISSTGHLILASELLGIQPTNFQKTFEIVIQLGAIFAVFTLYFNKLISNFNLIKKISVAFLPTALVGFILYPIIKDFLLGSSAITLNALFWGGIALIGVEWFLRRRKGQRVTDGEPSYKQALIIGTFQSISVIPGVSRAAATIVGGLLTGLNREKATEFSFLLAVPTMLAASAWDIYKSREILTSANLLPLFVGVALSFVFAALAVKFLIRYVKRHDFTAFGIYRIILAILFWFFVK
jgi:undecaprenyl-diphosphatase